MATAAPRTYADFMPPHSLQEEPGKLTLRVDLSAEGFKKEQIRVQIDNFGRLRISGERPLGADGSRWRRFGKEFQVPDTCDAAGIRARLDKEGILLITMPKLSAAAAAAGQDHEPAGHASAPQAGAPAAAEAEEEKGRKEDEDTRAAAAMDRPGGGQQDEQHTSSISDDDAAAYQDETSSDDADAAAYQDEQLTSSSSSSDDDDVAACGFAKDGRKMLLAIFAVMLALVAAGLFARCAMDPSAETPPSGNHIVSLSDS